MNIKSSTMALGLLMGALLPAYGQSPVLLNFRNANGGSTVVTAANPLPVAATATITFPTIGAAVPATGIYNGINVGGTLRGVTGLGLGSTFSQTVAIVDASGVQVTSFGGANASVAATGAAVPASATYFGMSIGGNLTGALGGHGPAAGALRVELPTDGTGTIATVGTITNAITLSAETTKVIGTVRIASGGVASGSFASGALASGSVASGAMVDLGAQADSVCATATGTCSLIALQKFANTAISGSIPAGSALIGAVTGSGSAGTAATGVLTVQGIASMTPLLATLSGTNNIATVTTVSTVSAVTAISNALPAGTNTIGTTGQLPYPVGSTPYTATATGTTGATTATLAGASSVTTYLCGFSIRANATAAATGNATVTGVITATMNFTQWTAPNASGLGITEMIFAPCIPASGTNQSVAVVSAAPGTGGVVSVSAWGYKL